MGSLARSLAYRLNLSVVGSSRVRLRICAFLEARRWLKSSVTTGFTYSSGTVGLATSTSVWDVYSFGSCVATKMLRIPQPKAQAGRIHQCLRSTLFTSAVLNSPFRTIHFSPRETAQTVPSQGGARNMPPPSQPKKRRMKDNMLFNQYFTAPSHLPQER